MLFAETWIDLEIVILSEIRQRKTRIIWYHLYVESKRNDTNGLIYKTETDSQTLKTNLRLPKGKGEGQGCIRSLGLTYTQGGGLVGKSCPTLRSPMDCSPQALPFLGFPRNTGVGCHFLLQEICLTQGSNPDLLHCIRFAELQGESLPTEPTGKPTTHTTYI